MPTKRKSSGKRRRASIAVRTVTRHVRSGFRRASHAAGKHNWLSMLLFGAAGYLSGDALNSTGIPWYLYDHNASYRGYVDAAYNHGLSDSASAGGGKLLVKAVGFAALADSLNKARKGGKMNDNEISFAVGALADPPDMGATYGQPGSGGPQGYWSS